MSAKLEQAYFTAMATDQIAAAVQACRELSILHGLRIEKQEMGPVGSFEQLNDKDYAETILQRLHSAMVFATVKPPSDSEQ